MTHVFAESLAASHAQEDAPWWEIVYRRAFPNMLAMHSVRGDGWWQRAGIDRVITLSSSRQVTIDEKVRAESWPDILLEVYSDYERKTPGWMEKDLACDYIAYAFVKDQRCYLLPFLSLRRAWIERKREWLTAANEGRPGFKRIEARNVGYTTVSVAVPIPELLAGLHAAQVVDWGKS